jgi:YbgC/YbaW family acyl-CoA thioester hydrolase
MPFVHEKTVIISEAHLDSFGHLNNARYLELFEQARWDLVTERGYGIETVRRKKAGPTILEVTIKFLLELAPRDVVVIRSTILTYERKVGVLQQRMHKDGRELACDATFTFGLFDVEQRRLVLPSPEWAYAVGLDALPPA